MLMTAILAIPSPTPDLDNPETMKYYPDYDFANLEVGREGDSVKSSFPVTFLKRKTVVLNRVPRKGRLQ